MTLFAHSSDKMPWEPLIDHLEAVSAAAGANARWFDADNLAEITGLLHDLGKVKPGFQRKLHGEANSTSHSGEGARHILEAFKDSPIAKLIAFCIAGHHSGLPNGLARSHGQPATPLRERLSQAEQLELPEGVSLPVPRVPGPFKGLSQRDYFEFQFFTRMLFSALVDADFIETERYYTPDAPRKVEFDLSVLRDALSQKLAGF